VAGRRLRRQRSRQITTVAKAITARPPTTPPTIAPMGTGDDVGDGVGEVSVGLGELGLAVGDSMKRVSVFDWSMEKQAGRVKAICAPIVEYKYSVPHMGSVTGQASELPSQEMVPSSQSVNMVQVGASMEHQFQ